MRTILVWVLILGGLYAFEVHRGTPMDFCATSVAQFNKCAEVEITALYNNQDNFWKTMQGIIDSDPNPCKAPSHREPGYVNHFIFGGIKNPKCVMPDGRLDIR